MTKQNNNTDAPSAIIDKAERGTPVQSQGLVIFNALFTQIHFQQCACANVCERHEWLHSLSINQ